MIQKHKAHPDQAGFFRRFLAFTIDFLVIMLISVVVYFSISEIAATRRGQKGEFSRMLDAIKRGESVVIGFNKDRAEEQEKKNDPGKKTFYVGGEKFNIVFEFISRIYLLHPFLPFRRPHPRQTVAAPARDRPGRAAAPGLVPVAGTRPTAMRPRPCWPSWVFCRCSGTTRA